MCRRLRIGRARRHTRGIDNDILQLGRQRADQFRARNRQDGDDLLHAELGLPARDEFGHRTAGELDLGRDRRGDPELANRSAT
jgi:hypothetical protein